MAYPYSLTFLHQKRPFTTVQRIQVTPTKCHSATIDTKYHELQLVLLDMIQGLVVRDLVSRQAQLQTCSAHDTRSRPAHTPKLHPSHNQSTQWQRSHLPFSILGSCSVGGCTFRLSRLGLLALALLRGADHFPAPRQTLSHFINVTTDCTQCLPRETTNCSASRTLSWTSRVLGKSIEALYEPPCS